MYALVPLIVSVAPVKKLFVKETVLPGNAAVPLSIGVNVKLLIVPINPLTPNCVIQILDFSVKDVSTTLNWNPLALTIIFWNGFHELKLAEPLSGSSVVVRTYTSASTSLTAAPVSTLNPVKASLRSNKSSCVPSKSKVLLNIYSPVLSTLPTKSQLDKASTLATESHKVSVFNTMPFKGDA